MLDSICGYWNQNKFPIHKVWWLRKAVQSRLKHSAWEFQSIQRENIPFPEDGSGRRGGLIKKDYIAAIKKFYEPEEELFFDKPPIDGGSFLRQWNMVVPVGHSNQKDVNVFFEAVRPKIIDKLLSDFYLTVVLSLW